MYSLKLDKDNRILSICVCLEGKEYKNVVAKRPEDIVPADATEEEKDPHNYFYIDGEYIYDPIPKEAPTEPIEYVSYDEMAEAIKEGVNSYNG